jgi:hypothetical protein
MINNLQRAVVIVAPPHCTKPMIRRTPTCSISLPPRRPTNWLQVTYTPVCCNENAAAPPESSPPRFSAITCLESLDRAGGRRDNQSPNSNSSNPHLSAAPPASMRSYATLSSDAEPLTGLATKTHQAPFVLRESRPSTGLLPDRLESRRGLAEQDQP